MCNALVHSCEQLVQDLIFECNVMCLCLHFDTVTQLKSFRHNTLADIMCDRWLEIFMAMVADKCTPMTRLHRNFVFLQHIFKDQWLTFRLASHSRFVAGFIQVLSALYSILLLL